MQCYAIARTLQRGDVVTNQALFSVAVSAMSSGFSSATVTFDLDTNIRRRRESPEFYGFIPDGIKGTVVFGCMIANSALLLLARSASAALLILANPQLFLAYMLGDVSILFIQKAARDDLHYFDDYGLLGDIFLPLCFKLVADYTGLLQLRGPGVLGGAYFSINQVSGEPSIAPQPLFTLSSFCRSSLLSQSPSSPRRSSSRAATRRWAKSTRTPCGWPSAA
jgi:hypothetical protein